MPPANGDLLTCRITGTLSGQPIINNLSFFVINPAATWQDQAGLAASNLNGFLGILGGGIWFAERSQEYAVQSIDVIDVSPGTSPMVSIAGGAAGAVTDSEAMPPNDCLAMTFRSDFRGPGGRGRLYLSGYTEGGQVGGFWTGAVQDAASAIGSALIDNFGELAAAADLRWVILHRFDNGGVKHAPSLPVVPPAVRPVMGFSIHNEVRSLGRRAMGRRIHRTRAAV